MLAIIFGYLCAFYAGRLFVLGYTDGVPQSNFWAILLFVVGFALIQFSTTLKAKKLNDAHSEAFNKHLEAIGEFNLALGFDPAQHEIAGALATLNGDRIDVVVGERRSSYPVSSMTPTTISGHTYFVKRGSYGFFFSQGSLETNLVYVWDSKFN